MSSKRIIRCKTSLFLYYIIFSVLFFVGCTQNDADTDYPLNQTTPDLNNIQSDSHSENAREENAIIPYIQFEMEEVIVEPAIQEYSFEDAMQAGEVLEMDGVLPGAEMGTWYIVKIDGVEYYYGRYNFMDNGSHLYPWLEEYELFNWAIVDGSHELANGIKVGMNESDILELYPNMMSVIDFEDHFIYDEIGPGMGWNGTTYPRSYAGMDSNWDYEGKDYFQWTDQFDYIIIADINLNDLNTIPQYLGLLIKDNLVSAITFYYPTAG